jgi:hypothetical protein
MSIQYRYGILYVALSGDSVDDLTRLPQMVG